MTDYLDEIQARADAATPGPWRWRNSNLDPLLVGARTLVVMAFRRMGFNGAQPVFRDHERDVLVDAGRENINAFPDAVFIAHARTDVPRLVAAIRAVEALCDRWEVPGGPLFGPAFAAEARAAIRDALGGETS